MWQPLGTVTPSFDLWLPFPSNAGSSTVFRLQYISGGNIENVFSSLWLRRVWAIGTFREKEVELAQKLYPQAHSVILWLPTPPAMELAGITPYSYEVKKSKYTRKGNYSEPEWHISMDVLQ